MMMLIVVVVLLVVGVLNSFAADLKLDAGYQDHTEDVADDDDDKADSDIDDSALEIRV